MADTGPHPNAVISSKTDWDFQQSYIERLMDHAALSSAHPDDTLILAGPSRYLKGKPEDIHKKLLPIGMVQNISVTQQGSGAHHQAIGSSRSFVLTGKARGQATIARLFVNGRNLLRVLYTNAIQAGVDASLFDAPAVWINKNSKFYGNLDSELFSIPFGIALFFRDKLHNEIGAFYLELCIVNLWSISIASGQNAVMENVNIAFDQLVPISTGGSGLHEDANYNPADPASSAIFQSIFNQQRTNPNPSLGDDIVGEAT